MGYNAKIIHGTLLKGMRFFRLRSFSLMINKIIHLCLFQFVFIAIAAHADNHAPAAAVHTEAAVAIEMAPVVWVMGTVIGRFDSKIAAEIEGQLKTVLDVGEQVAVGDVLATIEDTTYRIAAQEIEAEIRPIETMVGFYRREAARLEKLAQQNNAAKNKLEETEASRDEALANIRVVKAKLAMAHDNLRKTKILAPFAGIITERLKAPGEHVEAGDQIIRLIDTTRLEIKAYIQKASFSQVKAGDTLKIKGPTGTADGTVRAMIPVGDDVSRLYEVRVQFTQASWSAGTAVQLACPIKERHKVIAVSRDALVIRQAGLFVYKINAANQAEVIPVKTGISNATHIEVIGDINENDRIVIRGNERLRPGQTVKIING